MLDKVIEQLKPKPSEQKAAQVAIDELTRKVGKIPGAKIVVGGSFAKGTWISGMYDIDLFVCYNYTKFSMKSAQLSDFLASHLKKKKIKFTRLHGSRDYFETKFQGYNLELIPILEITKSAQAKNITDVSILHTKWVKKNLNGIYDDARLLKAFMIHFGCYGAESHIKGFSGYVCEILVCKFNSFKGFISQARKWDASKKIIIDVEKHHKGNRVLFSLNEAKMQSPLIVIDPVQKDRNAAAGLGIGTFEKFQKHANQYFKKPSVDYFQERHTSTPELKKKSRKGERTYVIEFVKLYEKTDVACSKILKAVEHITKKAENSGFKVIETGIEWEEKPLAWIRIKDQKLDSMKTIEGPPLKMEKHALNFKKIHKKAFVKKGKLFAFEKRKHTELLPLLKETIKEDYVIERCKGVEISA